MTNTAQEQLRISRPSMPRWVVAILVIQSLTLVLAFAGSSMDVPAAAAAQGRQENQEKPNVLPNAADQRQEQIRLLKSIADELGRVNASLDKLSKHAEEAADQNRPAGN